MTSAIHAWTTNEYNDEQITDTEEEHAINDWKIVSIKINTQFILTEYWIFDDLLSNNDSTTYT